MPVVVAAAWAAGSIPFSNIAARHRVDVDLREVGSGTVSDAACTCVTFCRKSVGDSVTAL